MGTIKPKQMELYLIRYDDKGANNSAYVLTNGIKDLQLLHRSPNFPYIWKVELLASERSDRPGILIDVRENNDQ